MEEGSKLDIENRREQALQKMQKLMLTSLKYCEFLKGRLSNRQNITNGTVSGEFSFEAIKDIFKGSLRTYQEEGVKWMNLLFLNGVNGILADEMGLGKTVQVIALICHLYALKIDGPYLLLCPLSILPNWESEFRRFAPSVPVLTYHGNKTALEKLMKEFDTKLFKFNNRRVKPVVLTTFQTPLSNPTLNFFRQNKWEYVIVDEAHRLKNRDSKLSQSLRQIQFNNRLLLTGTPLQNNLLELWSLLNFILPDLFQDERVFANLFNLEDIKVGRLLFNDGTNLVQTVHTVLAPFMLRRLKADVAIDIVPKKEVTVYCPMSKLQCELYSNILSRDINKLRNITDDENCDDNQEEPSRKRLRVPRTKNNNEKRKFVSKIEKATSKPIKSNIFVRKLSLLNSVMMFKRVVNHPFLVHFPLDPECEEKTFLINEDIVSESGKMMVLDALLTKLKQNDHKVLIFSTMTTLLDLIEEYVILRKYKYSRLDGTRSLEDRAENIEKFNTDPEYFIFLISTRAGGLGLNLTAADTVILYDRDWNPQVDVQAADRCHRIGQKKPVMVYSLVTKNTIDERILELTDAKLRLEKIVMKRGVFKQLVNEEVANRDMKTDELKRILENPSYNAIHSNGFIFTDKELDALLDRSELLQEMENKLKLNQS